MQKTFQARDGSSAEGPSRVPPGSAAGASAAQLVRSPQAALSRTPDSRTWQGVFGSSCSACRQGR